MAKIKSWVVTQYQVAKLFGPEFIQAATTLTALYAFKTCRILVFAAFTDADFSGAEATDIELNTERNPKHRKQYYSI